MKVSCKCGVSQEIKSGDKVGFVCDGCGILYDVDINGIMKRSLLKSVKVVYDGKRADITGNNLTLIKIQV